MESVSLDTVVRNMYNNRVSFIRNKNIELEREYFTANSESIPMSEIMQETSFEDHFSYYKTAVKNGNEYEISQIFMLLQEYFLFSHGHDMMFKKKLEADIFTSVPIEDLIYPKLLDTVKENYNDISVMHENPNLKANIAGIDRLVFTYTELQSLLYLLYCNDFQFPNGWEGLCPDTHEDIINILDKSGMTIGNFLHALIDFKCKTMTEILSEIGEPKLRANYLKKVETLKEEKHAQTKTLNHIGLPITYFLNHSFMDFLNGNLCQTSILDDDIAPKERKKIYYNK